MNPHFNVASADGTGPQAQPLGVERWVDAAGQPMAHFDLVSMGDGYKLLFCYQHACPGCHTHGFPNLSRLVDALRGENIRYLDDPVGAYDGGSLFTASVTLDWDKTWAAGRKPF